MNKMKQRKFTWYKTTEIVKTYNKNDYPTVSKQDPGLFYKTTMASN